MILNLINPDNGPIKYRVDKFPDGQQQVTIKNGQAFDFKIVDIHSRLNSFRDLELIICATKSLKGVGFTDITLSVPYFMGARSDRKFETGSNHYLRDVIAPIINAQGFKNVLVADPHSYVLEAVINNLESVSLKMFYDWCAIKIDFNNAVLVSPDAGAEKRVSTFAKYIGFKGDIVTCIKHRDPNGDITKTVVPKTDGTKTHVIIDDICDGGKTFLNIAEALAGVSPETKLIVTHGIFSKGLKDLCSAFNEILCTNSYQDINSTTEFGMKNERYLHKIKQFPII